MAGNGKDAMSVAELEQAIGGKIDPADLASLDGERGISRAFLEGQLRSLRQDQANALAVVNQCTGAIAICETLLKRMEAADGEEA